MAATGARNPAAAVIPQYQDLALTARQLPQRGRQLAPVIRGRRGVRDGRVGRLR